MHRKRHHRYRAALVSNALIVGGLTLASAAHAQPTDQYLNGTYRIDFDGATQNYNAVLAPTADTSAIYRFDTDCTDNGCIATGVLLSSSQESAFVRPIVTLYWAGVAWRLLETIDTPCPDAEGTRNQELMWALTPTLGSDVIAGQTSITTTSTCPGDDRGLVVQMMLATPVT